MKTTQGRRLAHCPALAGLAGLALLAATGWVLGCSEDSTTGGEAGHTTTGSGGHKPQDASFGGSGGGAGNSAGGSAGSKGGAGGAAGKGGAGSGGGGAGGAGGAGAGGAGAGSGGGGAGGAGGSGGSTSDTFVPNCPATCQPISGVSYAMTTTQGEKADHPPPLHGDLNPKLRGWAPCSKVDCGSNGSVLGLVYYPPDSVGTDPNAPKLHRLFQPPRVAQVVRNFRGYDWDWGCSKDGCKGGLIKGDWLVHFVEFASAPGEIVTLPASLKPFQAPYTARVVYADGDTVTLRYASGDGVVSPSQVWGYAVHLVGVCLEPSLKALYDQGDAGGRNELPALLDDQPLGRSCGSTVLVGLRDTGAFMDPRSETDWWQGHP